MCAFSPPKYTQVYYETGGAIATAHNVNTTDFVPASDEWRDISIDLSAYKNVHKLGFKFQVHNKGGNNFYIDDINTGHTTGINQPTSLEQEISIYPNPASGSFIIKYPSALSGNTNLEAFDVSGRLMGTLNLNTKDGQPIQVTRQSLNINKDGVYYIKLKLGENTFMQKLIILR